MKELPDRRQLIRRICERQDLSTYDPYDIWQTALGFHVKDFYNHHPRLGILPAALLTIFDLYINGRTRWFYSRKEYPIVRAMAAQALLNLGKAQDRRELLSASRHHLDWLCRNSCKGYSGPCWGLGFRYAVDKNLVYGVNTPLTTMTPYALEAFVQYTAITGDETYVPTISGIFRFLDDDVPILEEDDECLVTAYSDIPDRRVVNAASYVMYAYSMLLPYIDSEQTTAADGKIKKLYNYVKLHQESDGSWPYSPDSSSFVDCFHSCIVLKNLIKTNNSVPLAGSASAISLGYEYLKKNMFIPQAGLFERFARANKPGLIQYDLYDNAEVLNLAYLMHDDELVHMLERNITDTFVDGQHIFSQVDRLGFRHGRDTLRWAVMPYLYALSVLEGGR